MELVCGSLAGTRSDGHEEMGGRNRRKREGKRKTIDRRTRWIDLYPAVRKKRRDGGEPKRIV